ncbi:hypothetical protein PR202_ga24605 [Eleusine coracana subsp. coracana]|uniref:Bacterial surface antigen (D15) domain-containing protein n=1 Tax=Eleusine coracana subsp. coracana TaxID=191504 RepID=A0AAV5D8Z5_ELECO|nr:hypothetical protein PR202_ga24605 [Eleusine coracana subsp. coracana]
MWFLPWFHDNAGALKNNNRVEDPWNAHGLVAGKPVPLSKLDARKRYKVSEVGFHDRRRTGADANVENDNDDLFRNASSRLRAGGVYTRSQLLGELQAMANTGSFEEIDVNTSPKPDGTLGITVSYSERVLGDADRFRCVNVGDGRRALRYVDDNCVAEEKPCILPEGVREELQAMVRGQGKVTPRLLRRINDRVQKWYHDEGFACAQVVNFRKPESGEVACEVVEGDITTVEYRFLDKLGNIVDGNTNVAVIDRELPPQLLPGQIYNSGVGNQAIKYIDSLGLFSNVELSPRPDETKEGGVVVEVKLSEPEPKSVELNTDWSIVPWRKGLPSLAALKPGGTVSFAHRNIAGLNRSLVGSVTSSNLLNPKSFTKQSTCTYGLVVEEIKVLDDKNKICTHGSRILPSGTLTMDGPPTTLSGTGVDQMTFLQGNITRDTTEFVNGTPIGDRFIFHCDQGLGIGTNNPVFNRHQLSPTKFINLNKQEQGAGKPPPAVLALHGRYAGCIGDLPAYDAFALGGPHSVRGFNMGEVSAARNMVEGAIELSVPVTVKNNHAQVYAFAEHGNDLGSSKDVKGNPTAFFQRAGQGTSFGFGVKIGPVRAEFTLDFNALKGTFNIRFGERF